MAYDERLAERVRELVASEPALVEKRMFGGLAFLVAGHMCVAVSSAGGLLLRVGEAGEGEALASPHASLAIMRGRPMTGWVRVAPEGLEGKRALRTWVERGLRHVRTLPPKKTAPSRARRAPAPRRRRQA